MIPSRAAEDQARLLESVTEDAKLNANFVVLVLASAAIATLGLLENNAAVIIGAMIIAPLILPIQVFAFGVLAGRGQIIRNSLLTLSVGTALSVMASAAISWTVGLPEFGSEIVARSKPTLLDLGIAVAAGVVCGFAKVRPAISATLAGTAIAVALMPPLCVIGIGLADQSATLAFGASLLYATNLLGITLSCMVIYLFAGYTSIRHAPRAIATTAVVVGVLLFPLGASFFELLRQARLEATLKEALVRQTVTFRHVELVGTRFNWLTQPPAVRLIVRSTEPISPSQILALQQFARKKTGLPFALIFDVTPVVEVTGEPISTLPK